MSQYKNKGEEGNKVGSVRTANCYKNFFSIFVLLFLFTFSFSLVSATSFGYNNLDSLGTYTKGQSIELLQVCGTCTYNNISSIVYPDGSHNILDTIMTKRGMEYTYTFTNTDQLGTYSVNGFGDLDGTDTAWAYELEVTESGKSGIPIEWALVIIMILAYGLVIFGFKTQETPPITMGAMIMLMLALYIFVNGFGAFGAKGLLPQFIASAHLVLGAYLGLKSLEII